jgi:hypothetical protein
MINILSAIVLEIKAKKISFFRPRVIVEKIYC